MADANASRPHINSESGPPRDTRRQVRKRPGMPGFVEPTAEPTPPTTPPEEEQQ